MSYADFAADSMARQVWLWEWFPRDANGAEVTLRWGTERWTTGPTESPGIVSFAPKVANGLSYGVRAFVPRTTSNSPIDPGGELRLLQRDGDLDQYGVAADYKWDGARGRCLHGGYSPKLGRKLTYDEFAVIWEGKAESFTPGVHDAIIKLRSLESRLNSPLEKRRHRGNSWCLDMGASTYISFGSAGVPSTLNLRDAMSMDFVVFFDSAGMGTIRRLIGWDHSATTYPFQARINASNQLVFRDSAGVIGTSTFVFAANVKYWVGITIGAGTLRFFFLNLATMVKTEETYSVSSSTRPTADGLFRIGHASAGHDGLLEQIRIWSVAKTPEQMRQIRLRPMTATELVDTSLELSLLLDDGSGTAANDGGPNNSDGTINGTNAWLSSLEGGAELAGKEKINAFGQVPHVEPRFVGLSGSSLQKTYQLHADAITAAKLVVMEGGVTGPAQEDALTDIKTFLTTATAAAKFDVLRHAMGTFVRLGTGATLPLGANYDADAADGTYRDKAGAVAKYLITTRGDAPLSAGDLDSTAWTALDTAAPGSIGWVAEGNKTVAAAVAEILGGIGAFTFQNRSGKLSVARLEDPAGTADFALDERDIIDLRPLPLPVPISRATVRHRRNFSPMPNDRVSASATTAERIFATNEWTPASYRDATIADLHPLSEELPIDSYLIDMSQALAEASRQLALHGVDRKMWECISRIKHPTLEPFDTVELRMTLRNVAGAALVRFGFPARYRVLGWRIEGTQNRMSLILWG